MGFFADLFFGKKGGATLKELEGMADRHKFSDSLPWAAYDKANKFYLNQDGSIGYIWECAPLAFAGLETASTLEGLFRVPFPEGSVLQFILHADDYIEPFINAFEACKTRSNDLVKSTSASFSEFLRIGNKGLERTAGIPLRNFRLFFAVKMPINPKDMGSFNIQDIYDTIEELLNGARLSPSPLPPQGLLDWTRRIFNDMPSMNNRHYDENVAINKQVIFSETDIRKDISSMRIGSKIFRCTTPKAFPAEVDIFQTNQLVGGVWGMTSDTDQIRTPFINVLSVVVQSLKSALHAKCNLVLQQQGVGSFAPSLMRKKDEYMWATDELEKGHKFFRIIPAVWVYSDNERAVNESITRAKRIWESHGFIMQEDRVILPILFLSSLPFGLYTKGKVIDNIDRDFITPTDAISHCLPIQSDFAGGGRPVITFLGRKGQVCGIDLFDERATNSNAFVTASSGSGKSFLVNYLGYNYWSANALVRFVDIGGSYKKLTSMCDARFLDFAERGDLKKGLPYSGLCINPFTNIREPEFELPVVAEIVGQMVYSSSPNAVPNELENTILKRACKWAWAQKGADAGVGDVYSYLKEFPRNENEKDFAEHTKRDWATIAQNMALNLSDFTPSGQYGRYFNGRSNFDISSDEMVVLELEYLKSQKDLFKVVTLQIINAVTQDLYLSDRSRPRLIIFDEAWQFIKEGLILQSVIEEGYRRARKYGGSFTVITQSLLDFKQFGSVGEVIRANSEFKFYLASPDFEKAKAEKLIDYDDFTMHLLKSIRTNKPKYSEIFMDTPFGQGIGRLAVDDFSYYVYTSNASEIAQIERIMKERGVSYADAIRRMVQR